MAEKGKGWASGLEEFVQGFPDPGRVLGRTTTNSDISSHFRPKQIGSKTAYEANIYDQRAEPEYGTGAVVNIAKIIRQTLMIAAPDPRPKRL